MIVLKFFLHVSREEQVERLLDREKDPRTAWKLNPGDWRELPLWDQVTEAYEDAAATVRNARGAVVPGAGRQEVVPQPGDPRAAGAGAAPVSAGWIDHLKEMGKEATKEIRALREQMAKKDPDLFEDEEAQAPRLSRRRARVSQGLPSPQPSPADGRGRRSAVQPSPVRRLGQGRPCETRAPHYRSASVPARHEAALQRLNESSLSARVGLLLDGERRHRQHLEAARRVADAARLAHDQQVRAVGREAGRLDVAGLGLDGGGDERLDRPDRGRRRRRAPSPALAARRRRSPARRRAGSPTARSRPAAAAPPASRRCPPATSAASSARPRRRCSARRARAPSRPRPRPRARSSRRRRAARR